MRGWAHRNGLGHRVNTDKFFCQFTNEWQTFVQVFFAQMAQVKEYHLAARCVDRATFLLFVPKGLRESVTRTELHVFIFRLTNRRFRPQTVILQVAIAVFVDQNPALTATAFGHQNPRTG